MIVKKNSFSISSGTLYGFAGAIFGVVTVGMMIQSHLAPETYPACSERYANATMFPLARASGELLKPAELQSKLGGHEWGVLHNIAIQKDTPPSGDTALTVKFEKGGVANKKTRRAAGGVGFRWQLSLIRKAAGACLSYSVRVPSDFKFSNGGTLPGLAGGKPFAADDTFSTRMRWLEAGRMGIQPVTPKNPTGLMHVLSEKWLKLPRDQWVEIEQEVILNSAGQSDGGLRVWVDGRLQLQKGGIKFRNSAQEGFSGVIVDTHYASNGMNWAPAPKATELKISPMIVRWK